MQKIPYKFDNYKFGFKTNIKPKFKSSQGLSLDLIKEISRIKGEPKWMLERRIQSYEIFKEKPLPKWGGDLSKIDFDRITYFVRQQDKPKTAWKDVPTEIKDTFEKIGVPQSEQKFFAGTGAQFESEMIYHNLQTDLEKKGVIFESTDQALKNHPRLFRQYFGRIIPATDNKFAALNTAVWSGGSFVYIPKDVHIDLPLQAYFRINAANMGQFERTLIILDEGASLHYMEGCTAPTCSTDALHVAVVEIIVKKNAKFQYTTIQNWSKNVYNLVTKRATAEENAEVKWLDCNLGSKLTMKYPAIILKGPHAKGEVQSLAIASHSQTQDTGAKIIHSAPYTTSKITSKSISLRGGLNTYRGLFKVQKGATNVKSHISCDAMLLDDKSRSDTYPTMKVDEDEVSIAHEATVSRIGADQLFYLQSRGLNEEQAANQIVNGFANPIVKQLPMEYAVELNRLLEMEFQKI